MKIHLFIFMMCLISFFTKAQSPKVYINLVSHNEENYSYLSNPATFLAIRPKIIQMAQLAASKGAKWHLGSDHTMLRAVLSYDKGALTASTGGFNVLKYVSTTYSTAVECDPHAHESLYNYADVAKLHDSCGVPPGKVMSGFLYNELASGHDWQDYQVPNNGDIFPSYYWAPEILWGAGTPGHTKDPLYNGIWKPESMTNFLKHKASNHLINYGQGCKYEFHDTTRITDLMKEIRKLTNAIQSGSAPSNGFYCTSIFFRENYLNTPNFISTKLDDLMDSINVLVTANKVEWQFIPAVVNKWRTNYASKPFIMNCNLSIVSALDNEKINNNGIKFYPNPANDFIHFNEEIYDVEIFNLSGQTVLPKITSAKRIDTRGLPNGVYLIKSRSVSAKLIVQH